MHESQQLVIRVVDRQAPPSTLTSRKVWDATLPDWCDVYRGLSDDEIAQWEETILTRADLTRSSE